jgi:hypothetical protein
MPSSRWRYPKDKNIIKNKLLLDKKVTAEITFVSFINV